MSILSRSGVAVLAISVLGGCADERPAPAEPAASSDAATGQEARTLSFPGSSTTGRPLPTDHPPVSESPTGVPVPPTPVQGARLAWTVPDGWEVQTAASPMRLAQYRVPGPGGAGECVAYYFGPGQGGDPHANALRWASQFKLADGSPATGAMKSASLDGTAVPVTLVEVTGTYDGGMTMTMEPAQSRPGYMLLGGIAEGPDAPWFFKFTGPETTVRAQRESFEGLLRSLHVAH